MRNIAASSPVCEGSALRNSRGSIGFRIAAGVVVHVILTAEGIDAPDCARARDVGICGCYRPGFCLLPLVLLRIVERIRNLKPVARTKNIDVKRVSVGGTEIEAVEQNSVVADC